MQICENNKRIQILRFEYSIHCSVYCSQPHYEPISVAICASDYYLYAFRSEYKHANTYTKQMFWFDVHVCLCSERLRVYAAQFVYKC